jgi:hypothetical protein
VGYQDREPRPVALVEWGRPEKTRCDRALRSRSSPQKETTFRGGPQVADGFVVFYKCGNSARGHSSLAIRPHQHDYAPQRLGGAQCVLMSAATNRPTLRAAQFLPIGQALVAGESLTACSAAWFTQDPFGRPGCEQGDCRKSAQSRPFVLGYKGLQINDLAFCL